MSPADGLQWARRRAAQGATADAVFILGDGGGGGDGDDDGDGGGGGGGGGGGDDRRAAYTVHISRGPWRSASPSPSA